MIKGEYEVLKDMAQGNVCAEHELPLALVWCGTEFCHTLKCGYGKGHFPDTLTRKLSLTEELKAGTELPEPVKSNVERGMAKRQALRSPAAVTMGGVPAVDLATGELIERERLQALVAWARELGLRPGLGHVALMYGKPYVTLDGYLFHARNSGEKYAMVSFPVPADKRADYQLGNGDFGWIANLKMVDSGAVFVGLGVVTHLEMTEESKKKPGQLRSPVVAAKPWQMAQKRAERQALSLAFPLGEPPQGKEE